MCHLRYLIIFAFINVLGGAYARPLHDDYIIINYFDEIGMALQIFDDGVIYAYWINNQSTPASHDGDRVEVRLYYESLCPDCIKFDKEQFSPAVQKLGQYVDFHVYPYGNAKTIRKNGVIEFECQHGPQECYGNKLHACALDHLKNITEAVVFNSCMMGGEDRGSNDAAADRCAATFGIDSAPIKACAKSENGTELLEYYGEESKKANFSYVPYILINGKENDGSNFISDICATFVKSPPPCEEYSVVLPE